MALRPELSSVSAAVYLTLTREWLLRVGLRCWHFTGHEFAWIDKLTTEYDLNHLPLGKCRVQWTHQGRGVLGGRHRRWLGPAQLVDCLGRED